MDHLQLLISFKVQTLFDLWMGGVQSHNSITSFFKGPVDEMSLFISDIWRYKLEIKLGNLDCYFVKFLQNMKWNSPCYLVQHTISHARKCIYHSISFSFLFLSFFFTAKSKCMIPPHCEHKWFKIHQKFTEKKVFFFSFLFFIAQS